MKKGITLNSFFNADTLKYLVHKNELYMEKDPNFLLLYEAGDGFYRLHYYIKKLDESVRIDTSFKLVLEHVFRGDREDAISLIAFFSSHGIHPFVKRLRMKLTLPKKIPSIEQRSSAFDIRLGKSTDLQWITELFNQCFDPYLAKIPNVSELASTISLGLLYVATHEGVLAGALHLGYSKSVYSINHLAVAPSYRNNGIASQLLNRFHVDAKESSTVQLWVKEDNLGARKLYEQFGYQYDSWYALGFSNFLII